MTKKTTQKPNISKKNSKNNKKITGKKKINKKNITKTNNNFNAQLKKMLLDQLVNKLK